MSLLHLVGRNGRQSAVVVAFCVLLCLLSTASSSPLRLPEGKSLGAKVGMNPLSNVGMLSPASSMRVGGMSLRGGSGVGAAEAALTESEEAREKGIAPGGGANEGEVEELKRHLSDVDADSASYVPCTRRACPRFVKAPAEGTKQGSTLSCKCGESLTVVDVQSRDFSAGGRRMWRRFCPLDLPTLMPSSYNVSEPFFDEDAEVSQVRGSLLSNSVSSTLPASAWASQKLQPSGRIGRLLAADQRSGTVTWATYASSKVECGACVDRVVVHGGGETDDAGNCTVSWLTVASGEAGGQEGEIKQAKAHAMHNLVRLMGLGEPKALKMFQGDDGVGGVGAGEKKAGGGNVAPGDDAHAGEECEVLDYATNTWVKRGWEALKEGDVVRVEKMGYFPADLLLLSSSSPSEVCVQTACFDGDMSLRQWQVAPNSPNVDSLGGGDATVPASLAKFGVFMVPPPVVPSEWEHWQGAYTPTNGGSGATFSFRQLCPRNGRLLVTDWLVGMVLETGGGTSFQLSGGWGGQARAIRARERAEAEDKERAAKARADAVASLSQGLDPAEYDASTGIRWSSCFTDVPDDGNCMIHAVWLGLRALHQHYPALAQAELPTTAERFRAAALMKMAKDKDYRAAVKSQLELWLSVDCDVLYSLEDLFLLPPDFQALIVNTNLEVQGGGVPFESVDFNALVDQYIAAISSKQNDSGREFYLPLGELELETMCRVYDFRLQVVKTEAIDMITEGARKSRDVPEDVAAQVKSELAPVAEALEKEGGGAEAVQEALKMIHIYLSNVVDNPGEDKFRAVRAGNALFQKRVGGVTGGVALIEACGFKPEKRPAAGGGADELFYTLAQGDGVRIMAAKYFVGDFLAEHSKRTGGYEAVTAIVDPRTIHPEHIYDRNRESKKIVRILNVRTNHYQVHLPRKP